MWCPAKSEFWERRPLVGRRVPEELDVGAPPAAHHRDLLDHGARIDVEQVLHERARRVGERTERERCNAAHHVLEPRDRCVDVRNRDPDVVHAHEAELPVGLALRSRARPGGGRRRNGKRRGDRRDEEREPGERRAHEVWHGFPFRSRHVD